MRVVYMASALVCTITAGLTAQISDLTETNNLIHIYGSFIMANIFVILCELEKIKETK